MLYDSTKTLLQSILSVLEGGDESVWDDQIESGNTCLYEMHQMSGAMHQANRSDALKSHSAAQSSLPGELSRAIPHVRSMVSAIRRRDRIGAIESAKAGLAEMNGSSRLSGYCTGPKASGSKESARPINIRPGK